VPDNVACATSDLGCRCESSDFSLFSFEEPAESCPVKGSEVCCADLDSQGNTSECECETYACTGTDHTCECHWRADPEGNTIDASACTDHSAGGNTYPNAGICCDEGSSCNCEGRNSPGEPIGCARGTMVTSCAGTGQPRDCANFGDEKNGHAPRTSCDDLKWRTN
jgi:hypothetical protein